MTRFLLLYKIEVTDRHPLITLAVGVVVAAGLTSLKGLLP